jgi:hypothetical protein
MMRAALILASVSTLSAMELATPPRSVKAVNESAIQSMVGGIDVSRDTLTKVDRLEIPYVLNELPTRPISVIERMPSANSSVIDRPEASKTISRHALALPKPRPKTKEAQKPDRSKARTEVIKPCSPNPFDSLIRALNLSSGCQT